MRDSGLVLSRIFTTLGLGQGQKQQEGRVEGCYIKKLSCSWGGNLNFEDDILLKELVSVNNVNSDGTHVGKVTAQAGSFSCELSLT